MGIHARYMMPLVIEHSAGFCRVIDSLCPISEEIYTAVAVEIQPPAAIGTAEVAEYRTVACGRFQVGTNRETAGAKIECT